MVHAFKNSRLLEGLSPTELKQLEKTSYERTFPAGQTIFQEGDPGDGLFLVQTGLVQISSLLDQEQRRVLTRIEPGDYFGEMALLDNEPRSATAVAEKDSVVRFLPKKELLQILDRSPQVAFRLLREFSRRMREMDRQYVQELIQAERLNLLGRFTRSILHDIKSPLTVISMASEMACAANSSPEIRDKSGERIRKQVERVSNMINELLEFSRGSKNNTVLARTDYAQFLRPLLDEIRLEVSARSIELECATPLPEVSLSMDPRRLTNVFLNLVHNAADAMQQGGKIIFRFKVNPNELITEIEDTGSGIAPEIADQLFKPFATFGKTRGTGLGLSICKKIIEDHGGQIQAVSQPGRGALFTFSLPLRPA